jgi:hypothetical protein
VRNIFLDHGFSHQGSGRWRLELSDDVAHIPSNLAVA